MLVAGAPYRHEYSHWNSPVLVHVSEVGTPGSIHGNMNLDLKVPTTLIRWPKVLFSQVEMPLKLIAASSPCLAMAVFVEGLSALAW